MGNSEILQGQFFLRRPAYGSSHVKAACEAARRVGRKIFLTQLNPPRQRFPSLPSPLAIYSLVMAITWPDRSVTAIKLGKAINPLKVSGNIYYQF